MMFPFDGKVLEVSDRSPVGSASLHLAVGIRFLHEEEAVFEAMLQGWTAQLIGGRGLKRASVDAAISRVSRFQAHSNEWPWRWSAQLFDEWMADLVSLGLAVSTRRGYQQAVRTFCDYLCSPHYGWADECEARFGEHPTQVCHEGNTVQHLAEFEGNPGRRPLTRLELQTLLDHVDEEVDRRLAAGRKGAVAAYRDATVFKVLYAWGLRANELCHLDITDFYRNSSSPQFGSFGILQVRMGKSSRGSTPRRRAVLTLHQWAVDALQDYLENARPLMLKRSNPTNAVFVTERGTRLKPRDVSDRFGIYREELGLDSVLSPHALRHSYVTHLIEDGVDPVFVKEQVGHAYQSTTAIYTGVSSDFKNKMMQDAVKRILPSTTRSTL